MDYDNNFEKKIPDHPNSSGSNSLATASLVCSIIALVTGCCFFLAWPLGGIAIILGFLSKYGNQKLDSKSFWGIIMGFIALAGSTLITIFFLTLLNPYSDMDPSNPFYEWHEEYKETFDEFYNNEYNDTSDSDETF